MDTNRLENGSWDSYGYEDREENTWDCGESRNTDLTYLNSEKDSEYFEGVELSDAVKEIKRSTQTTTKVHKRHCHGKWGVYTNE